MRYFALHDFQYWSLALFIGLTCVVLACLAWGGYKRERDKKVEERLARMSAYEIMTNHDIERNPMAILMLLVYAVTVLWVLGYMIFIGIRGTYI
jgi:hypothetical protein